MKTFCLSKLFQLTFVDDLLPEKGSNINRAKTSTGGGVCTNSSSNNVTVTNKPLSKTNSTSIISQQPSNLAANGTIMEVTSARKNASENTHMENELKVMPYFLLIS